MDYNEDGAGDGDNTIPDKSDANLDRSKVHVLLCDKDPVSGLHVMKLLQQCLYRVTCVKSAGQVLEVLRSCSYEVDLILSEVELPKEKGLKMLKHIIRREQLHRIPIVIMSTRDEMGLIVKCLSLGAVDYLLKPLRLNELLNLWTHTWRRRRMLGLSEKHSLNKKLQFPFDLILSETSESNNTNGTNILSDDIDDLYFDDEPTTGSFVPSRVEPEGNPQLELSLRISLDVTTPEVSSAKEALVASCPRKTEFKIAQSSAFLSYAKATEISNTRQALTQCETENDTERLSMRQSRECHSTDDTVRSECIHGPPTQARLTRNFEKPPMEVHSASASYLGINDDLRLKSDSDQIDKTSIFEQLNGPQMKTPSFCSLPNFDAGITSSISALSPVLPPSIQMHPEFTMETSVNVVTGIPLMQPPSLGQGPTTPYLFPYYTHATHMGAPQLGSFNGWLTATNHLTNTTSSSTIVGQQLCRSERREAALDKFRRKRKDRCFDKKIRYVSRKRLAEQRPRIKGQFVKRGNGTNNMHDGGGAFEEYEEGDDDEEQGFEDQNVGSSPESVAEDP